MAKTDILKTNLKAIQDATADIRKFLGFLDKDSIVETDVFCAGKDYISGEDANGEGVLTGYATFLDTPVQFFAQNSAVMKGSMAVAHANKIVKCFERAQKTGTPIISVIDTSGVRIGEGTGVLEGYAKLLNAAADAKAEIPHICIIKGNAVGMMAGFTALADIVIMSDKAVLSVTPPMIIAANEKGNMSKLETLLGYKAHSSAGKSAHFTYKTDAELKKLLTSLWDVLFDTEKKSNDDGNRETPALDKAVTTENLTVALFDDGKFIEYSADFAPEMRCLLGKINDISVGVIVSGKTKKITGNGLKKSAKFVQLLDAYNIALVSFVDYDGVEDDLSAELGGLGRAVAKLVLVISSAEIPKIAVISGKATGLAYSVLASKGIGFDYTLAFTGSEISVLKAETAVEILFADELKKAKNIETAREKLRTQYSETSADPFISAKDGFVDNIIAPGSVRPYVASALAMLLGV